jgi:hypothetical protein
MPPPQTLLAALLSEALKLNLGRHGASEELPSNRVILMDCSDVSRLMTAINIRNNSFSSAISYEAVSLFY